MSTEQQTPVGSMNKAVPCPQCGAKVGAACVDFYSGAKLSTQHRSRLNILRTKDYENLRDRMHERRVDLPHAIDLQATVLSGEETINTLAAKYGVSTSTLVTRRGVKSATRQRVLSGEEIAARIRLGELIEDISAEVGKSVSTVRRSMNDAGFRSNGKPGFKAKTTPNKITVKVSHEYVADDYRLSGAACVGEDPELWFPSTAREREFKEPLAKAICAACPVRVACLKRALEEEEPGYRHGIRGGLNEDERATLAESGAA